MLRETLEGLDHPPPALPALSPGLVIPDGTVIWHYGPEPPADADCVGVEGAWWVGVAGDRFGIEWSEDPTGQCSYGSVTMIAFRQAPDAAGDGDAARDPDPDVQAWRFNLEAAEPVRVIVSLRE